MLWFSYGNWREPKKVFCEEMVDEVQINREEKHWVKLLFTSGKRFCVFLRPCNKPWEIYLIRKKLISTRLRDT